MTYIELINNFWNVRRIRPMTSYEADLYFYLLKECNSRNWTNPFELPTRDVEYALSISRKTICDLRNKLQQKGLISFKEGNKRGGSAIYTIVYVTCGNISGNINGNTIIKNKTKTKNIGGDNSDELFPPEPPPKKKPPKTKVEFIPPTVEEVREYFRGKLPNWELQADIFYNHFSGLGWKTATGAKVERWDSRANLWIIEKNSKVMEKQKPKDKTVGMLIKQQRQETSLRSMRPSSRDMMLSAIKQRYPTFSQASAAYSTSLQPILLADLDKAYSEKSPTLSDLERMYGDGSSALWAKTQLLTIDFASATKESADENALNEFSNLFVRQYHYIKLTEFILFVARFKLGRYGKFYGYFDTITIGEAFRKFLKDRSDELDIIIRNHNNRTQEQQTPVERNHQPPDDLRAKLKLR